MPTESLSQVPTPESNAATGSVLRDPFGLLVKGSQKKTNKFGGSFEER